MIKSKDGHYHLVGVAGHSHDVLAVNTNRIRCGQIEDGVSFSHWRVKEPKGHADAEGGWVISFADLESIYLAAKSVRGYADIKHSEGAQ